MIRWPLIHYFVRDSVYICSSACVCVCVCAVSYKLFTHTKELKQTPYSDSSLEIFFKVML